MFWHSILFCDLRTYIYRGNLGLFRSNCHSGYLTIESGYIYIFIFCSLHVDMSCLYFHQLASSPFHSPPYLFHSFSLNHSFSTSFLSATFSCVSALKRSNEICCNRFTQFFRSQRGRPLLQRSQLFLLKNDNFWICKSPSVPCTEVIRLMIAKTGKQKTVLKLQYLSSAETMFFSRWRQSKWSEFFVHQCLFIFSEGKLETSTVFHHRYWPSSIPILLA